MKIGARRTLACKVQTAAVPRHAKPWMAQRAVPRFREGSKEGLVEAAGIEPASVTGTPKTSTCLVICYLTRWEARSHATRQASHHLNFAPTPET